MICHSLHYSRNKSPLVRQPIGDHEKLILLYQIHYKSLVYNLTSLTAGTIRDNKSMKQCGWRSLLKITSQKTDTSLYIEEPG